MKLFLQKSFSLNRFTAVIIITVITSVSFIAGRLSAPTQILDRQPSNPTVLAHQSVNKTFSFPIVGTDGNTVTTISYTIQSADIQHDIILKGERASAVDGKVFLILNLKATNPSDKNIQIYTRDYVRLSEGGSSDLLAADVHNDPLPIQPISTKYTRIGFTIDTNQKKLLLHVGQIDGEKTTIQLHLKS